MIYKIITKNTPKELEKTINLYYQDWKPSGGITCYKTGILPICAQVIYKEE